MRKQLLAILSALGLTSSAAPASAQVLKGSKAPDTKAESTIKLSKNVQEDAASKGAVKITKATSEQTNAAQAADQKHKLAVSSVEGGHATSDVVNEKKRKAGGESAAQDTAIKKSVKGAGEANASQKVIQNKRGKAGAEAAAHKGDSSQKVLIGLNQPDKAGQNEAAVKIDKAKTHMGDGSVRPAAGPGGGPGKNAFVIKGEKHTAEMNAAAGHQIKKGVNNAAEDQAAQQNAAKKAVKADQPR